VLLSEPDTILNASMSRSILHGEWDLATRDRLLHGMAHADHMPPSAAALLKQKLFNMHVTFDVSTYCCVLLMEVRFVSKSREHMQSDTQTGGKTNMSSAILLRGNSPWSSPWSSP